jgi:transposase
MGYNFRDYNQQQLLLLAPNLDDWLPQHHLARFIADVVDALDLKPLLRRFRDNGQGGAAFHPAMMLKVLLNAYCVGVPSSRKIAQTVIDDVAFRWLAANSRPDFRTIAAFRRRHLEDLKPLFLQVLLMCKQAGMVRVGVVALDGTKVAANAALDRNRTWEKLSGQEKALLAEVEAMLGRAEATD